jgi:hypothetical protein
MFRMFRRLAACTPYLALCAGPAMASDVHWRVALSSDDDAISMPSLPADHTYVTNYGSDEGGAGLANSGDGLLGFQLAPYNSGADGNWYESGIGFRQYAGVGATGALGPNRSGSESGDVFRALYYADTFDGGTRAFGARANAPSADAGDATLGIWQSDGAHNVEFARVGTDGPLGPNLGSGMIYTALHNVNDTSYDVGVRSLNNRRVMFAGRIGATGTLGSDGLSVYTPGSGNTPCLLSGSTDDQTGPGIVNYVFPSGIGISATMTVSPRGEAYASDYVTRVGGTGPSSLDGIWQFCDGAPKPGVLTGVTGPYGPHLPGNDAAVFGTDNNGLWGYVAPSEPGSYFFSSGGRLTPNGTTYFGLFHHDAAQQVNNPLLFENQDDSTGYGPHVSGHVFHDAVIPYVIAASGKYGALRADIAPTGSSSADSTGLWRLTTDGGVQPVAIGGDTGAYAPAPGRTWDGNFYKFTVFDDGEIVTLAETEDTATSTTSRSCWRLAVGAAPVEILKVGDLVDVPTASGIVATAVTSIDPYYRLGLPAAAGRDTWFSANGDIIAADITLQGHQFATLLIRGQAARPDYIFAAGTD